MKAFKTAKRWAFYGLIWGVFRIGGMIYAGGVPQATPAVIGYIIGTIVGSVLFCFVFGFIYALIRAGFKAIFGRKPTNKEIPDESRTA